MDSCEKFMGFLGFGFGAQKGLRAFVIHVQFLACMRSVLENPMVEKKLFVWDASSKDVLWCVRNSLNGMYWVHVGGQDLE